MLLIVSGNILSTWEYKMNCTVPILNIDINDCVGDSLGKHNYNTLLLDTSVCNLSSILYNQSNNLSTVMDKISSIIDSFKDLSSNYNISTVNDMSIVASTVKVLSSFWQNNEFSIQYPLNAVVDSDNPSLTISSLSSVDARAINNLIVNKLIPTADAYLNSHFLNVKDNSIVNLIFPIYNIVPDVNDPNQLIKTSFVPNNFSYTQRQMVVNFYKENIYLVTNIILRYGKINGKWGYITFILGGFNIVNNKYEPIVEQFSISPIYKDTPNNNPVTTSESINLTKLNVNTRYYTTQLYAVTYPAWSNWMNDHAVWVNPGTDALAGQLQVISRPFNAPYTGNYTINALSDNILTISIDNKEVLTSSSFTDSTPNQKVVHMDQGDHILQFSLLNIPNGLGWSNGNPAGMGFTINNSNNNQIWNIRDHMNPEESNTIIGSQNIVSKIK